MQKSRKCLLVPLVMLLFYSAQCIWFVRTQSLTFDEPFHLVAGLEAWRYGRFEQSVDHPPLGHLLPTVPIARGPWQISFDNRSNGSIVGSITPDPVGLANRTRPVNVILGVLLGLLLWATARKLFSVGAANVAISRCAFSPSLIAHFSMITTDGICTLMVFVTAVQVLRWRSNPSRVQTALLGIVLGLLLLAKLSTLPLFVLTVILILALKPLGWERFPRRWNFRGAILAACIAFFVVWAGYFFHVSRLKIDDGAVCITFPHREPMVRRAVGVRFSFMKTVLERHVNLWIPAGEYLEGIGELALHNQQGHRTYLGGSFSRDPNLEFHLIVALLKWPPVVWLLFLCSVVLFLWGKMHAPSGLYLMLLYPACIFLVVVSARITMGERHFLPVYPFVLLLASSIWQFMTDETADRVRTSPRSIWVFVIIALLIVNATDVLRYAPDYLSYMNIAIPNRSSYRYLSDSNVDWGQGLLALRKYEADHPNESMHLAYFGNVDPKVYGIRAAALKENEKVSGTVVISETHMSGQYLEDPSGYEWVTTYPLKTILNHSLFVFEVPENSSKR
jgi:hypothetical protein